MEGAGHAKNRSTAFQAEGTADAKTWGQESDRPVWGAERRSLNVWGTFRGTVGLDGREQGQGRITQGRMGHGEELGFYSTLGVRKDRPTPVPWRDTLCPSYMALGPLGTPGCAPLSYRGSLSSSPSPLPACPSAGRAGTLPTAPRSASSPRPAPVQSRCSHLLRNRQISARLRAGQRRQSGPWLLLITAERAPRSWECRTPAARLVTHVRSGWRGTGVHPVTSRPGPAHGTALGTLPP